MTYKPFHNFVLRTPLYPVSFIKKLTSKKYISDEDFKNILKESVIQEALFLASPPLYDELQKWITTEIKDGKKKEKLRYSLLKYLSRMSSRCTPFGLFAGCCIGKFDNQTRLTIGDQTMHSRQTRLDMNFLVALSQELAKNNVIKGQLHFYPNTSIYKVGKQIRYVEYHYKNTRRNHQIVAVDDSKYLKKVLGASKVGLNINKLADCLVDDEITELEATSFIDELIECQILVSELEPSVSGPEFLEQILQVLTKLKGIDHILEILNDVENQLKKIDKSIGNPVESYIRITEKLKELNTQFDFKYLFQTNLFVSTKETILDSTINDSVLKGISLFNKISLPPKDTFLNIFKEAFYERFEEREVLLSKALDVEMGVGYKQNQSSADINPLIDDLILPGIEGNTTHDIKWTSIHTIFQRKLLSALENKEHTIKITESDFKDFYENWDDLPDTMSTIVELVVVDGEQKIKCSSIGGSSAANLLGRFCHGNEHLNNYTQQIIDFEAKATQDKKLAEIVHLPESRTGNILMRPSFRHFEIPYLAKSLLKNENQISIDDLTLSIKNGQHISLKSKKHNNEEIIPHLTNAHNYSNNALPVYHFLCDMQTQGKRGSLGINIGPFKNEYGFVPRIEYKNLIITEALWNIKKVSILPLLKVINSDDDFEIELMKFKTLFKIPSFALLDDGDNELLINFENITSVKMLLDTVKKRDSFILKEFLFNEDGVVKSENDENFYTNEIILSFYNSKKM
ncbi:MAG: hypothetical protein COW66_13030 [Flavobacteriaceae bacterium CG18_big_fil_WC_8_21_14_2_50_34_36]|nr:hypothetical protein [Flavobacteriia bacterium]NCT18053.1 hypothetical protein [Flavobacteriia bacterium]PIQ17190.1 MAG: hypothetical protein COW66_13030 [Flavobacteriaceae bacterium CG18_big_fil_WC_8_21_14_2_50_34_36]PJC08216.1 MAG: hypothetical protein CO068_02205 [Flavobacteriaceae bacterium CG_4_9_14_0_8_um_filter_34_30]